MDCGFAGLGLQPSVKQRGGVMPSKSKASVLHLNWGFLPLGWECDSAPVKGGSLFTSEGKIQR